MNRPNIIWICTDQQRSDSLGCSGNPVARTPNIDSLAVAVAGTRFTRPITPMQIYSPRIMANYSAHMAYYTRGRLRIASW